MVYDQERLPQKGFSNSIKVNLDGVNFELNSSSLNKQEGDVFTDKGNKIYSYSFESGVLKITSGPEGEPCNRCEGSGVKPD